MLLPRPRGVATEALTVALRAGDPSLLPTPLDTSPDAVTDEELQLALWICYELHYRGFVDVRPQWEWEPQLISLRRGLEWVFLERLRSQVPVLTEDRPVPERLQKLVASDDGPQLARFLQRQATRQQFAEFAIHRSVYQLKEADPYSWAIPRLGGRAKAAIVEIQADEYGRGDVHRMHSELFRRTLRGLAVDDTYGYYVDAVPAVTLAISNLVSAFGLRRELRGALAGHLAAFEMTSSAPNRRYSKGLRRLGGDAATRRFYDEHVTADALHEQLAVYDLCGTLAEDEPELTEDIVFGAAACLYLENRFAEHVLACWCDGTSSLRGDDQPEVSPIADVS